eukprot:tig00020934_g16102.t1
MDATMADAGAGSPAGARRAALAKELAVLADVLKIELSSLKPSELAEQQPGVDPDAAFFVQASQDIRAVMKRVLTAEALYSDEGAGATATAILTSVRELVQQRPEVLELRGTVAASSSGGAGHPPKRRRGEKDAEPAAAGASGAAAGGVSVQRPLFYAAEDAHYFGSYASLEIHEEMLKDDRRTLAYRDAIATSDLKGKAVMDVGAGTGILSLFCARAGARKVYACEASDVARHAEAIVAANGLQETISVVRGRVEDVESLPEKVDAIVSEWMGYGLLYESMLHSVVAARDRFLKPGGLVRPVPTSSSAGPLRPARPPRPAGRRRGAPPPRAPARLQMMPSHARLYLAPFSDEEYFQHKIDYWRDVHGFSMEPLVGVARRAVMGRPAVDLLGPENLLAPPALLREIDCGAVTLGELAESRASFAFKCDTAGALHGFALFFDVEFRGSRAGKGKGPVVLSTHPRVGPQHWKQTLLCLEGPKVEQDDRVEGRISIRPGGSGGRYLDIECEFAHGRGELGAARTCSWSMDYEGL